MRKNLLSKLGAVYSVAAMFALIHFVILSGVAGVAYARGKIDRQKLQKIASLMRGDDSVTEATEGDQVAVVRADGAGGTSAELIKEAIENDEQDRLRGERSKADLRMLKGMVDRRALKLQRDIEEHQRRVATSKEQAKKRRERELSDTHKKTIDTIGGMDPKKARDFLRNTSDADAVKILLSLPDRKRKGILESCKTREETMWRDQMLNQMLKQPVPVDG